MLQNLNHRPRLQTQAYITKTAVEITFRKCDWAAEGKEKKKEKEI